MSNPTWVNSLTIYLLAIPFRFLPPSILVARMFAAFWMFAACLLLGVLAKRISGQLRIGIIVAAAALMTPWLFEVGRLAWDPHFSAFTVVVFLLAAYRIQSKKTWRWQDIALVAGSLALVTYGYLNGRVLAPLFALGLLFFASTKHRLVGVIKTWLAYGVTLVPLILFNRAHPGVLTKRLWDVSYIRPDAPWKDIASQFAEFVRCYLQDQSLTPLLMMGDPQWRHHVEGSGGAILFATFILAMAGLLLVIARRWRDPWWRFVLYGLATSIVSGAITDWPFHEVRLMGYAVFLLVLTVPALEWLLAPDEPKQSACGTSEQAHGSESDRAAVVSHGLRRPHFGSAFLESCWPRPSYKRLISKLSSAGKDQSASMPSTFHIGHSMTQQCHGQSGQSIWRTASGGPLISMRIGMPLWKAGLYPSFFVLPMERNLRPARLCLARTQTARIAKPSRKAACICFTGRSSRQTLLLPHQRRDYTDSAPSSRAARPWRSRARLVEDVVRKLSSGEMPCPLSGSIDSVIM